MICANAFKHISPKQNFSYKGRSRKTRLGHFKKQGLVQDHHVIPRQHRNHPRLISIDFNINSSQNLVAMPTPKFIKHLRSDRYSHAGGHVKYNALVLHMLNTGKDVNLILQELKQEIRFSTGKLPNESKHLC